MSKFAVLFFQNGGCDYTIGCGQLFEFLPETLQSMEQAVQYVLEGEGEATLNYNGKNRIHSCQVFEIFDSHEVDMTSIMEEQRKFFADRKKNERRKAFEKLKQEFDP